MTRIAEVTSDQLEELLVDVRAGHKIILTVGDQPQAMLVPLESQAVLPTEIAFPTFPGKVLEPGRVSDRAEEFFSRE